MSTCVLFLKERRCSRSNIPHTTCMIQDDYFIVTVSLNATVAMQNAMFLVASMDSLSMNKCPSLLDHYQYSGWHVLLSSIRVPPSLGKVPIKNASRQKIHTLDMKFHVHLRTYRL